MTLKALFKMAGGPYGGDLIERGIVEVTGGPECHVEALIDENPATCFSATLLSGVRMANDLEGSAFRWYGLDTRLQVSPEAAQWAKDECGRPYNILGAIISGFKPAARHDLQALFCSQAFALFYDLCGASIKMERPNPHVLSKLLLSSGAVYMPSLPTELFISQKPRKSVFQRSKK